MPRLVIHTPTFVPDLEEATLKRWTVVREDAPGMAYFSPRFFTRRGASAEARRRNLWPSTAALWHAVRA